MKALTVQQPWAWAIFYAGKTVENRTHAWSYRGPLAIHAGKRVSMRGQESPLIKAAWSAWTASNARPNPYWPTGAIIGIVDLVDAHPAAGCCKPWGEDAYPEYGGRIRIGISHLVLDNPRPVEPVDCVGRLGLWTPSAEVLLELANS